MFKNFCKLLRIALSIDLIQLENFHKGDVLSKKFNLGTKKQFFTKKCVSLNFLVLYFSKEEKLFQFSFWQWNQNHIQKLGFQVILNYFCLLLGFPMLVIIKIKFISYFINLLFFF
jgi:hypothetical protein